MNEVLLRLPDGSFLFRGTIPRLGFRAEIVDKRSTDYRLKVLVLVIDKDDFLQPESLIIVF